MKIQRIEKIYWESSDRDYSSIKSTLKMYKEYFFRATQGKCYDTGKTASEAINNLLVNIYGI